jgi:hypothetical protein
MALVGLEGEDVVYFRGTVGSAIAACGAGKRMRTLVFNKSRPE